MASLILGTAGHIDHGKTALVQALTGTDTDRLKEEKARGITIELGFAELAVDGGPHFGVVDVPGHEAFVRAMVAGAAGMDVVLLIVAADEGVMPQTREHLAIVQLLGVPELVVALTKSDAVDEEWMELVDSDVGDLLADTPYAAAPRVTTSATERTGLDELTDALRAAAERVIETSDDDLARLPLDRVFTIQGTGTVVTGTLWSGALEVGDKVRILPGDLDGRIRGIQAHGRAAERAESGDRAAVALVGDAGDRSRVVRGQTLVTSPEWRSSWMLTTRVEMLSDTQWTLEHNQRVHVHLGTAEVLARCALLEPDPLGPGDVGWVQLRLEEPVLARGRDRFVIRAYSPVTTIGGGVVAEPDPPKRNRLEEADRKALATVVDGEPVAALTACLGLSGWAGARRASLPILTGLPRAEVEGAIPSLLDEGVLATQDHVFAASIRAEAEALVLQAVEAGHGEDSLRPTVPLAPLRAALPEWAPAQLAEVVLSELVEGGRLEAHEGGVRMPGFEPQPTADQERASDALLELLAAEGLAAPLVEELPEELRERADFWSIVRRLEGMGRVRQVADGMYVVSDHLEEAADRIAATLAGRSGLGPSDFRDALPVTRKHLIPLLNYFDGKGTTVRTEDGRAVPANG